MEWKLKVLAFLFSFDRKCMPKNPIFHKFFIDFGRGNSSLSLCRAATNAIYFTISSFNDDKKIIPATSLTEKLVQADTTQIRRFSITPLGIQPSDHHNSLL